MGPETTPERVSEDLMQAVTCLQRAMVGMKSSSPDIVIEEIETPITSAAALCTLVSLTDKLERVMETNKTVTDVLGGKMKCTTCGATSVGLLSDCHDSATSTATTVSHRNSEEPPRQRKASGDDDEELDDVCSSIGTTRSIRSVSSSVHADDDENSQTLTNGATPMMEIKHADEEEEEHDLVMKTILSTTTTTTAAIQPIQIQNSNTTQKKPRKKSMIPEEPPVDPNLLDQFLQSSLLGGLTPEMLKTVADTPPQNVEENEEEKDQNNLLSNFFQMLFANQQGATTNGAIDGEITNEDILASQPSPPADQNTLESLAMIESLFAESMSSASSNPDSTTPSAADLKASRKRKSTPMKVPKMENGGYVCPMDGCNKVFKEKGSVHRHFVTHIGMRFNCDKCKASYTQKHALMLHQKIHSNPDAYQCRGCGTNYTTQNGLRLHRQRNPGCIEITNAAEYSLNASLTDTLNKTTTPTKLVLAP